MTVRELIALLQTYPPDAPVIKTLYGDYEDLEPADVEFIRPKNGDGVCKHHGHWMLVRNRWSEAGELPAPLVPVVHFKGN